VDGNRHHGSTRVRAPSGRYPLWAIALSALSLAAALTGCSNVVPEATLLVQAEGASSVALDGATVDGTITVLVRLAADYDTIDIRIDGASGPTLHERIDGPPLALVFDTTTVPDGAYTLEAEAFAPNGAAPRHLRAVFSVANADSISAPPGDPGSPGGPADQNDPASPDAPAPPEQELTPPITSDPEDTSMARLFVGPSGTDAADGSASAPLRTVMEAVRRAVANRALGVGTRITLYDGVYRESVARSFASSSGAAIVLEAHNPGGAVISGADVFTAWTCSSGVCTHAWPYAWGADPDDWNRGVGELARRREMVVVDGVNLGQVSSLGELVPGAFYVDDVGGRMVLKPPHGSSLAGAVVEVAVRPHLLRLQGLNDLVVRGIRFQHAASPFRRGAVEIVDQNDVLLDGVEVRWNGQHGLSIRGSRITVRGATLNDNGSSGIVGFRVTDMVLEDSESSFNNWRGVRAEYDGWEVGNKFYAVHRMVVRRHTAVENASRGFWFDTDVRDVVIEASTFADNRREGLFIEKVAGPIAVRDSAFLRNGDAGIVTSATQGFTLERSSLEHNARNAVRIAGDFGVRETDFETGEQRTLVNAHWTWRDNTMVAAGTTAVIGTSHPQEEWDRLMDSAHFDRNRYAAGVSEAFTLPGERVTFEVWRTRTQQDADSLFSVGQAAW
jgi:hypothetical protein